MSYVLTLMVIGPARDLRISEKTYNDIKEANDGLPEIVAIEEKFDALMENYIELESTLLTLGARHMVFIDYELKDLLEPLNLVSRRIVNVLSSARLYRDALPQHVARLLGPAEAKNFKAQLKNAAAQPMNYRIIEAIRNYAQHQDLPLVNVVFRRSREGVVQQKATAFAFWLEPLFDSVAVAKSRDIAANVRAALQAMEAQAKIMPLLRQYVEYVGALHQQVRDLVKPKERAWEHTHSSNIERYKRRYPKESPLGLAAGFRHVNRTVSKEQYLSEERAAYRKFLKTKNLTTVNLSIRYVKWSA